MEFLNGGILFLTYCEPAAMHPKRPAYPSKVDLERLGIHGQGKRWEI
jgi:hypothetical protein